MPGPLETVSPTLDAEQIAHGREVRPSVVSFVCVFFCIEIEKCCGYSVK